MIVVLAYYFVVCYYFGYLDAGLVCLVWLVGSAVLGCFPVGLVCW